MARKQTNSAGGTRSVDSIRHKDKRANIPTEELRDFVAQDEKAPKTMLYPRDPSLDPQLVWKGKDEQDRQDLAVPVVPIYIQEKIHPQALIEDIRRQATKPPAPSNGEGRGEGALAADLGLGDQLGLFADFNGLDHDFDKKVDFYQHDQSWTNRMILGDSLLVMTSLAQKEGLAGKVQTIYFDPPYGIKFGSNWQVSTRKRDVKDGKVEDATRQPEQIRAFRDTWRLGIHSYLAYLRDRLVAARELLTETGSIFVQIGDENVHLVRCVLDEVFGGENFISQIACKKTTGNTGNYLGGAADYLLWFGKNVQQTKYRALFAEKEVGGVGGTGYTRVELADGTRRSLSATEIADPTGLPRGARIFTAGNLTSQSIGREKGEGASSWFAVRIGDREYKPSMKVRWKTNESGMARLLAARRIAVSSGEQLAYVRYYDDFPAQTISNVWTDTVGQNQFGGDKVYVVQTALKIVERCFLMTTDPGDIVLDPTSGSGTTAFIAEQWGRRWITCDTSRVALALTRTRLMAAKYPYYLLADSPEGIKKEAEITARSPASHRTDSDIRKGFVYGRVPHVTLKSIANNPDIKEGMTRQEIDAAIARHAEQETLYDKPYQDNKRIRVSGPFTVESLSPHRVLPTADDNLDGAVTEAEGRKHQDFVSMILENLRKAGVQNTRKNERLKFDRLDPFAGTWIHAVGEYAEESFAKGDSKDSAPSKDASFPPAKSDAKGSAPSKAGDSSPLAKGGHRGVTRRAAVSIGPEHGTVGPLQVKEAAKEAVQGVGFDVLIVCGFAFDPHVSEEVKRYGQLTVLPARMNPDLAMGDELLKKTGAGNLFMVFGEPDVEIRRASGGPIGKSAAAAKTPPAKGASAASARKGTAEPMAAPAAGGADAASGDQIVVEVKGVDVYDPTTGQIRSSSTDDIACWFIDTDYNGESFFVRHAYFTGAAKDGDGPYDKLKRALRAEIDEGAWSSLYSTTSRPFPAPSTGKIAVKVINHYGDEVLRVFDTRGKHNS